MTSFEWVTRDAVHCNTQQGEVLRKRMVLPLRNQIHGSWSTSSSWPMLSKEQSLPFTATLFSNTFHLC